jgi:ATP-dependent DNA helicase RecG
MKENGSPKPSFKSDRERTHFLVEPPIHGDFVKFQAEVQSGELSETELRIPRALNSAPRSMTEICMELGYRSRVGVVRSALEHLHQIGAVSLTVPDAPRSPKQKRVLTGQGKNLLK